MGALKLTHAHCIPGRVAGMNDLSSNSKQWENSLYMTMLYTNLSMYTSKTITYKLCIMNL